MNSIPFFIMTIFDDLLNNPIRALLQPFYNIYGDWFTAILFGMLGVIYYSHSRNIAGVAGYFLILGAFGSVIFHPSVTILFAIVTSAAIGAMMYKSFVIKHREF